MKDYNLVLVTPPAIEPISLIEAKNYLRIDTDDTDDDNYITGLISTARTYCEDFQNRAYITQTWELSLNEFVFGSNDRLNNRHYASTIELPKGNLQEINTFTYKDVYGAVRMLISDVDYVFSTRGILGQICPPYGKVFPIAILHPLDPIVINYTCGYGLTADKVPLKVKQSMYLLISHWYENREIVNSQRGVVPANIGFTVDTLLKQDRITVL